MKKGLRSIAIFATGILSMPIQVHGQTSTLNLECKFFLKVDGSSRMLAIEIDNNNMATRYEVGHEELVYHYTYTTTSQFYHLERSGNLALFLIYDTVVINRGDGAFNWKQIFDVPPDKVTGGPHTYSTIEQQGTCYRISVSPKF